MCVGKAGAIFRKLVVDKSGVLPYYCLIKETGALCFLVLG